jgi:putative copper export protein
LAETKILLLLLLHPHATSAAVVSSGGTDALFALTFFSHGTMREYIIGRRNGAIKDNV